MASPKKVKLGKGLDKCQQDAKVCHKMEMNAKLCEFMRMKE